MSKTIRSIVVVFSILFFIRVATIFTADRLSSISMLAEKEKINREIALSLVNISIKIDSANADIYMRKYDILQDIIRNDGRDKRYVLLERQLHTLRRCIQLCPSWPAYHMYYAVTVRRMSPQPNIQTRKLILSEMEKGTRLKPYSKRYSKIYKRYLQKSSSEIEQ